METFLLLLVGLIAGCLLAVLVLYPALKMRLEAEFEERFRQQKQQITEETLKRSSATLRGQIGERFAPLAPGFSYEPADARFLGSPVDYVVFDGMAAGKVDGVAFVEVKIRGVPLTPFQRQVKEAIDNKRIAWRVVELDG